MDRRIVAGLVGLALVGTAEGAKAQAPPARDPSGQPSVGLLPLRSINESINDVATIPSGVPVAPRNVPTSPVGTGPAAVIPNAPVLANPVSMTPIEPIHQSINRGASPPSRISSMFRGSAARPVKAAGRTTPPPSVSPSADLDTRAVPASLPPPDFEPGPAIGRPAPFAGQAPELPRPQSDPAPASRTGRAAPFASEAPAAARPQGRADDRPSEPRRRAEPANPPAFRQPATSAPTPPSGSPDGIVPVSLDQATPDSAPWPPAVLPPPPSMGQTGQAPANPPSPAPDESAVRVVPPKSKPLNYAAMSAATVGDEIISFNELERIVSERYKEIISSEPGASEQDRRMLKNQLAQSALTNLIDQALVLQEARRKMQNPKAKQMFDEFVDKLWKTEELTPLLRKTTSANVYELKLKLAAQGKSYEGMKESFRKKVMAREFLNAEIHTKITSDLAEMRAYYTEHLKDFEQPARMTWREIEVNFAKYPSRAAARQKAEEVLARLLRDEDFGSLAKSISNGPTATKGGIYPDMQPGSYGIPVVNDELNRIPVGQVSAILEAPGSFHIIRVDSRRDKGPLRMDEVQDQIRDRVIAQNYQRAVNDYFSKLRAKTLVRTMFDAPPEPTDPAVQAASATK